MTRIEIDAQYPGWVDGEQRPEGWEWDDVFIPRVMRTIQKVADEFAGGTVLVICHGGVIIGLERELGVNDGRIPNLHGRIVVARDGNLVGGERLQLIPSEMRTGGDSNRI
jgi:broad specificity phosphatase PhoE